MKTAGGRKTGHTDIGEELLLLLTARPRGAICVGDAVGTLPRCSLHHLFPFLGISLPKNEERKNDCQS